MLTLTARCQANLIASVSLRKDRKVCLISMFRSDSG
jgi:hypothetical protein